MPASRLSFVIHNILVRIINSSSCCSSSSRSIYCFNFYYCRYYCFIIKTNSHCLANKTVCACQVLFLCVCLFVLRVWWSRMHARARIYLHTHTHTHKCMHTCTHSYVRTCTHMHTHTCTRSKFVTFDSAEPPFVICFLLYYETHVSS